MTPGAGAAGQGSARPSASLTRRPAAGEGPAGRASVAGKFLAVGDTKLYPRGATYGPFEPNVDGVEYHVNAAATGHLELPFIDLLTFDIYLAEPKLAVWSSGSR